MASAHRERYAFAPAAEIKHQPPLLEDLLLPTHRRRCDVSVPRDASVNMASRRFLYKESFYDDRVKAFLLNFSHIV